MNDYTHRKREQSKSQNLFVHSLEQVDGPHAGPRVRRMHLILILVPAGIAENFCPCPHVTDREFHFLDTALQSERCRPPSR